MKNTTRRSLLNKLGLGAAALAAITVAGTSNLASAKMIPINPNRTVQVGIPAPSLQVTVKFGPQGFVLTSQANDAPIAGISQDRLSLRLGVQFNQQSVAITGLDSVINRAQSAGRCWMDDVNVEVARF
jgi:hypothetical protein